MSPRSVTFGCLIEGEAVIGRLLDETIEALHILEREEPVDRLRGFDAAMFRRALTSQAPL